MATILDVGRRLNTTGDSSPIGLDQASLSWTNPGQSILVPVTKALSVETHSAVAEDTNTPREPVAVWWNSRITKVTLKGELTYTNHRATPITLDIDRDIDGEAISADGKPDVRPSDESVSGLQRKFSWHWTLQLKADETGSSPPHRRFSTSDNQCYVKFDAGWEWPELSP